MLAALAPDLRRRIRLLEIHESLPSTNDRLLQAQAPDPGKGLTVCLADYQTAGKGRGGKHWDAPPGLGLLLSVACKLEQPPAGSLPLALGVAVAKALESIDFGPIQLKWPNDLIANGAKLGGILVESVSQRGSNSKVVAGLGMNLRVTAEQIRRIKAENGMFPTSLEDLRGTGSPDKHQLAAAMIAAIAAVLERHNKEGFAPWQEGWRKRDWLAGRPVQAVCGKETYQGEASGVDASGALMLTSSKGKRRILSAEIRL